MNIQPLTRFAPRSNSWGAVANMITTWFGRAGHIVVVAAEAAAGNVEDIGDRIGASLEEQITGVMENSKAKAEATQRARQAVQISSMCVASEVGSSIIILILLILEIMLGDNNAGDSALSKGLGAEAKTHAM